MSGERNPEAEAERAEYWREQREDAEMLRQFSGSYAEQCWIGPDVFGNVNRKPPHFAHIVVWEEHQRLERIAALYRKVADRVRRDRRARDQALRHRIKTWTGEWA